MAYGDLQLRALGVELRGQRVQRDRLEADEVRAARDARGDGRCPARVLRDHLPVAPRAAVDRAGEEAGFVDLEPLESGGCSISAGSFAVLHYNNA